MTNLVKKATLGVVLGASALTAAALPAEAQRYRHRHHHDDGATVAAGIVGLMIGATIASNDRRYDYDRGYYRDHGYYPSNGYYYRDYYPRYRHCSTRKVYDPYLHRRVRVRYCR